jgi:hypothetical protein
MMKNRFARPLWGNRKTWRLFLWQLRVFQMGYDDLLARVIDFQEDSHG